MPVLLVPGILTLQPFPCYLITISVLGAVLSILLKYSKFTTYVERVIPVDSASIYFLIGNPGKALREVVLGVIGLGTAGVSAGFA